MPKKILVSARRGPTLKLADDLYLAADGRFHRLAPPGAGILDAGPGLDLTEATKASLDGTTLAGLTNQLGTLKPLGAEDAGMSLTEMATHLGIPARVQNLVGTAYNFAAAMSVAVAGYQFVVSLLEWQGILKKKDVVSEIRNTTNAIYATLIEGLWGQRRVEVANWMTQAVGAADILKSYMESPTHGWRDELKQRDKGVGDACTALLDRAYQTIPYYPREHDQKEWVWGLPWLEVPPSVAGQLQPGSPTVQRMWEMEAGKPRWDYRLFLGELLFAMTVRIAMMRALFPDFRSSGRYKEELTRLLGDLVKVQDQWLQSLQRTRDIDELKDFTQMLSWSSPLPSSGSRRHLHGVARPRWPLERLRLERWRHAAEPGALRHQPVRLHRLAGDGPEGPPASRPVVPRAPHAQRLSGIQALGRHAQGPADGPSESETVSFSVRNTTFRSRRGARRQVSPPRQATTSAADRRCFRPPSSPAPRAGSSRSAPSTLARRPSSRSPIASCWWWRPPTRPSSSRRPGGALKRHLQTHEVEMSPTGRRNIVKGDTVEVHLQWQRVTQPGQTTVTLRCLTPDVNVDGLSIVVEEKIKSGALLRSEQKVEIVQRVLRLPQAYFDKLDQCRRAADGMLEAINMEHAIGGSQTRIPPFDPVMYTQAEYLAEIAERFPDVVKRIARRIASRARPSGRTKRRWGVGRRR